MAGPFPGALALTRRVLRVLVKVNVVYAALILALFVASLVAAGPLIAALGVRPAEDNSTIIRGMRLIMVAGIAAAVVAHVILTQLLAIVETVRAGDPFVVDNADRLQRIGWAVLGLELLHLIVGAIALSTSSESQPLDIDWSFSLTRWIAVLLLFVLARVFEQGARMREDLEGTV